MNSLATTALTLFGFQILNASPVPAAAQSGSTSIFEVCLDGGGLYNCVASFESEGECLIALHKLEADINALTRSYRGGSKGAAAVGVANLDLYYFSACDFDGSDYIIDVRIPSIVDGSPRT